ncbi:MAG: DNA-directed DNA polymerase [archaeon]|nr:DNA-directed DNA polymerase [archaeon]MDD2477878.1 DNA-directed DNA polymerase [Candidatus ainarchaeum sp.]MDD3084427.1 DNA-directed DNA polymerase [Candidatus ainarchaeum sp.]MDD4220889.1 DNA-directed DNA polymerase [Candidatus ainarchaeum sp.]MDD4662690.1 DNA-directed DNA polymerase [Candidatus ainarchaeum sp.]
MNKDIFSKTGILIDVYYDSSLRLVIREESSKSTYSFSFFPYFYLVLKFEASPLDFKKLETKLRGLKKITKIEKKDSDFIYKLEFEDIDSFMSSKNHLLEKDIYLSSPYEIREYDLSLVHRFFLDYKICNFSKLNFTVDKDNQVLDFKVLDNILIENLNYLTFDIEVLPSSSLEFPKPDDSPVISIAISDNLDNNFVFLLVGDVNLEKTKQLLEKETKFKVFLFSEETKLIESFALFVGQKDPDVIFTYNGDGFDFEYLSKRYKVLSSKVLDFGKKKICFHKSSKKSVSVEGSVHLDVYVLIKLLNYLQVFNHSKLDLNSVYQKITGNKKLSLGPKEMRDCYLDKDYKKLIEYNLDDVSATHDLGINYYSIVNEISKLVHAPFFDILRTSAGAMVERLFIDYFVNNNQLVPNKPDGWKISQRHKYTFQGAFVKKPIAGLHEDIAVVDFRSYHISLIIAYNISPETIVDVFEENTNSVLNKFIKKEPKGFVPKILGSLLALRISIKEKIKGLEKKDSREYRSLFAKQFALKVLLASTYGYMGFAGARWYCRNCLDIMYHLVRTKIQNTIKAFEDKGYTVIYSDTDSCFIKFKDLSKLKKDLEKINLDLPKSMFLELEDIFKSGIFVLSRDGKRAAKKKYALLKEDGTLKIKGFEFVRRDWCPFVKEVQKKVLELVLEKKDPKEAINLVKKAILDLQEKKVPLEKMIIQSFVRKNITKYKNINPAMSAVLDGRKRGANVSEKEVIEYIITDKPSKTISEKARLVEFVKDKEYDVDYYLNNQLLPAVFSILEVFDVSKDELVNGKKQKGLGDFF